MPWPKKLEMIIVFRGMEVQMTNKNKWWEKKNE